MGVGSRCGIARPAERLGPARGVLPRGRPLEKCGAGIRPG